MKVHSRRSVALVCAAVLLCAAAVVSWGQQPGAARGEPVDPGALHKQVTTQLVETWAEIARQVAENPTFLGSPEAEPLMRRAEALKMLHREMWQALRPDGPGMGPGPEENGRFQFVQWVENGPAYWVMDTRTGELQRRETPPER